MAFYCADSFTPDTSVGYLLKVTNQMAATGLEPVFAHEGMSAVQWQVLLALIFDKAATAAELARHLNHDKGAMTRVIDQMETSGWLTRERDPDDRRHIRLALTPEGRAAAHRCRDQVLTCWNDWLADWPRDEVARLVAGLQKLRATLSAVAA